MATKFGRSPEVFPDTYSEDMMRRSVEEGLICMEQEGLLSGKFTKETTFAATDHRNYNRDGQQFNVGETFAGLPFENGVELADMVREKCPANTSMAQMALRWILDHKAVSVIIPGASSSEQVKGNATASDLDPLSSELHQELSDIYREYVHSQIRGPY